MSIICTCFSQSLPLGVHCAMPFPVSFEPSDRLPADDAFDLYFFVTFVGVAEVEGADLRFRPLLGFSGGAGRPPMDLKYSSRASGACFLHLVQRHDQGASMGRLNVHVVFWFDGFICGVFIPFPLDDEVKRSLCRNVN